MSKYERKKGQRARETDRGGRERDSNRVEGEREIRQGERETRVREREIYRDRYNRERRGQEGRDKAEKEEQNIFPHITNTSLI